MRNDQKMIDTLKEITSHFCEGIYIKSDSEYGSNHSCGYDFVALDFENDECYFTDNQLGDSDISIADLLRSIDTFAVEYPFSDRNWLKEENIKIEE